MGIEPTLYRAWKDRRIPYAYPQFWLWGLNPGAEKEREYLSYPLQTIGSKQCAILSNNWSSE